MPIRASILALAGLLLVAGPASAATKTEPITVGQVTGTLTYDYKQTRYGLYDFSKLKVTIDRAGQRLVDDDLGKECGGCEPWPAAAGARGETSIKVRDLDNDDEPEVLVDLFTGGANCCFYSVSWRYDADRNVYVKKVLRPGLSFPYTLRDLNRDGAPEFETYDYRFAYKYGSNADTPRPLRIFQWDAGRLVDTTLSYPGRAAKEAAVFYRGYLRHRKQKDANVRGFLAAYLADSYRAGNGRIAWRRVVAAYRRGDVDKKFRGEYGPTGKRFLTSVRAFLEKLGYLRRA